MTECPPREVLEDLVGGALTGPAADTAAGHLDTCHVCQATLDALTADWSGLRPDPRRSAPTVEAPPRAFLDRLKAAGDAPRAAARPAIPGYELLDELGRGGAGVVYRARQLALDRIVALKILLGGHRATAEELARFRAEALAAGRASHPGIVQVYEVGEWSPGRGAGPLPFICLEFVGGGTLGRKIDRNPLPPREAAGILADLAAAIHSAHTAGILHRDLKPANVLLDAGTGRPKVADFGLARRLDLGSGHTHTGMLLGTPSYMAPEQAQGSPVDVRTDVYGLGAVLYEMLTGRPPFQGPTPLETVLQVAHTDPIAPRRLQPTVPRDLETICLKCLEKSPAARYPSAAALGEDVGRFLAGKPTRARPVGPSGRVVRLARRHPVSSALATLLFLVIVGSLVGLSRLYVRSERARQSAEADRRSAEAARDGSRAASEFLQKEILAAPRLDKAGKGDRVTVLQLLDAASPKVDDRFAGQPELAAGVHHSFGEMYLNLGQYAKAVPHLERAIALRTEVLGPDHESTLESEYTVGETHRGVGQLDLAKATFESVAARAVATLGPRHEFTLKARSSLGTTFAYLRDFEAAGRIFEEGVRIARETNADAALSRDLVGLSIVRGIQGRRDEQVAMLREALAVEERLNGPTGYQTIITRGRLGEGLMLAKQYAEAETVLVRALEGRRTYLSPTHPSTYSTQGNLGDVWLNLNRPVEAEQAFREALAGHQATMPPTDQLIHLGKTRLAAALSRQGRYVEAEPLLLEAVAGFNGSKFVRADYRRRCVEALIDVYEHLGRPAEVARWKIAAAK